MVIAVDMRGMGHIPANLYDQFMWDLFTSLASQTPANQYFFLYEEVRKLPAELGSNISTLTITPSVRNYLQLKWWYDVKLPSVLKLHHVDVFVCLSGVTSLKTSVHQLLLWDNQPIAFSGRIQQYLSRNRLKAALRQATSVVTLSNYAKEQLANSFKTTANELINTEGPEDELRLLNWEEREKIKEQYASGCEYFICHSGTEDNFVSALKAFSIFKKWQKSNMKLVVAGSEHMGKCQEKLLTYKYKEEVILISSSNVEEHTNVIAAAYSMIYVSNSEQFAAPVVQAMNHGVPIITAGSKTAKEIAGEAGLYAEANNYAQLAEHMKVLYKDEELRKTLAAESGKRAGLYSARKIACQLGQEIQSTATANQNR